MSIEESIQQIETLIEAWQLDEADLNQTDINAMQALLKENQELKKHLKVPKACNLKTLEDYKSYYEDTTREQILEDTYIEYCAYVNLAHRYSELKKQLEEYLIQNIDLRADIMIQKMAFPNELIKDKTFYNLYDMPTYEELLVQQKEFIKYLEDGIKSSSALDTINKQTAMYIYSTTLRKYKEIIGVSDENNKQ